MTEGMNEVTLRKLTLRALIAVQRPEDKNLTVTSKRSGVLYSALQGMTSGRDISMSDARSRPGVTNAQMLAAYLNVTVEIIRACAMNSLEARMAHGSRSNKTGDRT